MDQDKVLQVADDQINFLDRMSAQHRTRLETAIERLERRITDRLTLLDTDNKGSLIGPKTNLSQAQKIHSDLSQIFDEEYGEGVRKTIKEYSEALPIIQEQYKEMGEAAKFTGVDKDMIQTLKTRDLNEYSRYGVQAQDQIATALYDHVVAQSPFSSLRAAIAGALIGHVDARGRPMSSYAKQMANDGIMNFHNAVNLKKGQDLGFTHFLYIGNIIADSRDFCVARAGNVYTKEQIDSWTFPWKGKSGPAMTHRGGFNCRHHWQPVRKEWVPEGGIEVQSFFDRAGVMPVSKLPAAVTGAPKFKAYQAWQKSVLIDKKPLTAAQVAESVGGNKAATKAWLSHWEKGFDLPKGWQSVVRDLEAEAGGFERAVVGKAEAAAVVEKAIPKVILPEAIATKEVQAIAKTALETAKEEIGPAFTDYQKTFLELTGETFGSLKEKSLSGAVTTRPTLESVENVFFKQLSGGRVASRVPPQERFAFETEARGKARKVFDQLNSAYDKVRSNALAILELEQNPVFDAVKDVNEAKLFYDSAIAKRDSFIAYFKSYGIKPTQFRANGDNLIQKYYEAATESFIGGESAERQLQKAFYAKLFEHEKLVKRVRYQWLNQVDEATYLAERRKVTDSITEFDYQTEGRSDRFKLDFETKAKNKAAAGLDFVPIDLLDSMAESGYRIKVVDGTVKGSTRAFYRDADLEAVLFGKDGADVFAHEWGHAIDGFFEGQGNSGGYWGHVRKFEGYVDRDLGADYRKWYKKTHSSKKGTYTNGDGDYWDNNWISNYEGRIYPGRGVGQEWWAMNIQRYSSYHIKVKMDRMLAEETAGVIKRSDVEEFANAVVGPGLSTTKAMEFNKAKKMYPELTDFIEKTFGERTMIYRDGIGYKPKTAAVVQEAVMKGFSAEFKWVDDLTDKANLSKLFKFHTFDKEVITPREFAKRVYETFGVDYTARLGKLRDWMDSWKG